MSRIVEEHVRRNLASADHIERLAAAEPDPKRAAFQRKHAARIRAGLAIYAAEAASIPPAPAAISPAVAPPPDRAFEAAMAGFLAAQRAPAPVTALDEEAEIEAMVGRIMTASTSVTPSGDDEVDGLVAAIMTAGAMLESESDPDVEAMAAAILAAGASPDAESDEEAAELAAEILAA